jgi:hypothetical protein
VPYPKGQQPARSVGFAAFTCIVSFFVLAKAAPEAPGTIATYFSRLDAFLADLAADSTIAAGDATAINERFAQILAKHKGFLELLRTDSKGKVIGEAVRSTDEPDRRASVSDQPWFSAAAEKSEPYYGSVEQSDGTVVLIWAKPIRASAPDGQEGVLAVKIGLRKVLAEVAGKASLDPFELTAAGETVFAHQWEGDSAATEKALNISGLDDVRVRWVAGPSSGGEGSSTTDVVRTSTAGATGETRIAGMSARLFISLAVGIVIIVAVLLIFFTAGRAARRHHEKLMRDIEETSTINPHWPPTRSIESIAAQPPPTGNHPKPKTDSYPNLAEDELSAVEQTVELSEIVDHYGPSGTPQPEAQPAPKPQNHPPTTQTSLVPPEVYEQVRGQIRAEMSAEIQSQISHEIQAAEKRMQAKAEAFTSSVETHVNQLVAKLTEAEAAWNGLSTALKSGAQNLQEALENYKRTDSH